MVAPATVNTINKWGAGICDTLPLGILVEAIGKRLPIVAMPVTNPEHAAHPTASLDPARGTRIVALMRRINRRYGTTFVFSTHDPRVLEMADRRVDLEDGAIVRLGLKNGDSWSFATPRDRPASDDSAHSRNSRE